MPRKRRLDQGPPVPRCKNACLRCRTKRLKCSDRRRPCTCCIDAGVECLSAPPEHRGKRRQDVIARQRYILDDCNLEVSEEANLELARHDDYRSAECPSKSLANTIEHGVRPLSTSTIIVDEECFSPPAQEMSSIATIYDSAEITHLPSIPLLWTPANTFSSTLLETAPHLKVFWHHYVNILACLHSSHEKSSNPIIRILGPIAQSSDTLLAVLLASSLDNYKSLRGEKPDQALLASLLNTAVVGIQTELSESRDGQVSDTCLASVIALCDFEVVARKRAASSSWRMHLEGARRIIQLRGGPQANQGPNPDLYRFLVKWLAYFDVMSSITPTSTTVEPLFEGVYWRQPSLGAHISEDDEAEFRLDPYMSFLQDVMPMFFEIGVLTQRKQLLNAKDNLNLRDADDLLKSCRMLEARLRMTLGKVSGQAFIGATKLNIMINCHDAFVQASLIHLYRRVEGLSSHNEIVRAAVGAGLCHIANSCFLEGEDFVDSSLLFPLFTLGCEVFETTERRYLLDRLRSLQALGLGNVDRAIDVLQVIWADQTMPETGPNWDDILGMFDWEVNLA